MVHVEDEPTVTAALTMKSVAEEKRPILVVLTGNSAGRSWRLDEQSCTMGRSTDADFLLDDEGISRLHAKVVLATDGKMKVHDLKSTNGTFVNDERIETHTLENGDRIRLGAATTIRYALEDEVQENVRNHLFISATHDPLTGLQNKRAFDDHALRAVAYSRRHKAPLSLILFDIDHFKSVNDNHGHLVGDEVLKCIAKRITDAIRVEDTFCRVGGEEFAILLPGIDGENGILAADRVRTVISKDPIQCSAGELDVSISLGVAHFDPEKHTAVQQLYAEADGFLYEAKHHGRNCVRPEPIVRRKVFRDIATVVNSEEVLRYGKDEKNRRSE